MQNESRSSIPFNEPRILGNEIRYIQEAVESGRISGDGRFTLRCQAFLERAMNVPKVLLTTSCTHALEMAAVLLDIKEGDEVIVPSFTFVSTANAFALQGAKPVFADIRPDTCNLDESRLSDLITPRTKAIVPVHYAGVACEMDAILSIAREHGIVVVEDNAHGFLGKYKSQYLGTMGDLATQSFHETKNITCGEGGALIVNNAELISRAEIIREKGTDRKRFFRGEVDKYSWVDKGSSYLPSDILAAFLYAQLESIEQIQEQRKRIWDRYHEQLHAWAIDRGVCVPTIPDHCEQSYHMFYLMMPSLEERDALIQRLADADIKSVFHYVPLHSSPMGQHYGGGASDCPVTEDVSDRLLRLPFYSHLTPSDQDRVVETVLVF